MAYTWSLELFPTCQFVLLYSSEILLLSGQPDSPAIQFSCTQGWPQKPIFLTSCKVITGTEMYFRATVLSETKK